MPLPDAVDEIKDVQKGLGDRHGPIHPLVALLQAAEGQGLALEVDTVGREFQRLRDAAARIEERQAERANHTGGTVGGFAERVAFASGEVEAVPLASWRCMADEAMHGTPAAGGRSEQHRFTQYA